MMNMLRITVWEGYILLFSLVGIIALRLWTGRIRTQGLLEGRTRSGSRFLSASRVQLLVVTLATSIQYLHQLWQNPHSLPDVPRNWLVAFGASHVLYLGNKFHGKRTAAFHI